MLNGAGHEEYLADSRRKVRLAVPKVIRYGVPESGPEAAKAISEVGMRWRQFYTQSASVILQVLLELLPPRLMKDYWPTSR